MELPRDCPDILRRIVYDKTPEIEALAHSEALHAFKRAHDNPATHEACLPKRNFYGALAKPGLHLIAEFKRASPSKGDLRPYADPVEIALAYERAGASAISVLTDAHFKGSLDDLKAVSEAVHIPVMRKDFIVTLDQIYESRMYGADAILLIAALLEPGLMHFMITKASELGMGYIVECHTKEEMIHSRLAYPVVVGINNRDLRTFREDKSTTARIIPYAPETATVFVTESAIRSREDIECILAGVRAQGKEINAMLVGEALMKGTATIDDIEAKVRSLLGK